MTELQRLPALDSSLQLDQVELKLSYAISADYASIASIGPGGIEMEMEDATLYVQNMLQLDQVELKFHP